MILAWRRGRWLRPSMVVAFTACSLFANELTPTEVRTIDKWLNCEECVSGERAAVRALGPRAVPKLAQALRDGPPATYRDNMRSKFNSVYTGIHATRIAPDTAALPRAAYVERALENYVAGYQQRAALGLGDIGGPEAINALQGASGQAGPRADVIDVIKLARALADSGARFWGSITPRRPRFGDTVIVRPPASQPFDGNELAHIEGSPVRPNDTRLFADSNRLGFLAVAFPGERVLTVRNVGTSSDTQYAAIAVRTLTDANDRGMSGCPDPACLRARAPAYSAVPSAVNTFFTLWRTASGADTVDLVRFEPSGPLHITAQLQWSDSTTKNLDLRWTDCAGAATGNIDGATGAHPERSTVDIPGGRCWLLWVILSSPGLVPPLIAHLRVSP